MPTQTDNDQDSRDIADRAYHDTFDSKGHAVADDLASLEADLDRKYSQDFDATDESGDSDSPDDNRQTIQDGEQAPDNNISYTPGRSKESIVGHLRNAFKKKGASFAIVGLLTGIGTIGSSVLLGPAALLATMEKVLTNHNSNDTRSTIMMRRAYIGGLLSGKDCRGSGVKCKFTSMSENQKANWEKHNFTLEGKTTADGRFKPTSITFPDGTRVTTGKAFDSHAKYNLDARKAANLVMNPRASTFTDTKSKFRTKVLAKLKLSISEKMTGSKDSDKEKRTQAMNGDMDTRTGVKTDGDGNSRIAQIKSKLTNDSRFKAGVDKYGGKLKKITSAVDIASFACTAYSLVKTSIAGVKLYYYQELIRFALPWMQLAAQQYTYGDIDPELMEYAMDRLTWYSTKEKLPNGEDDPSYQKSAFDSNGLRSALYGDFDALTNSARNYTTWWMTSAVAGSDVMKKVEGFAGGKEKLRTICATAKGASLIGTVFCFSNPLSAALCVAAVGGLALFGDDIVEYITSELVDDAVKKIADADLTSNLKGVPLGDAIASGVGLLLLEKNMGSGMRLATSAEAVSSFISATYDDYYEYIDEIAIDDARKNPFDTSNSYSLASRFAVAINQYRGTRTGLFDNIVNLFAIGNTTTTSFLNPHASAIYSQPSELTRQPSTVKTSLERCEDQELQDIKVMCEWQGKPVLIIRDAALTKIEAQAGGDTSMIEETVDYMLNNEYINEDGSTKGSDDDTQYTLYKKYCTEDREFPFGTSDFDYGEISTDDNHKLDWALGARCAGMNAIGEQQGEDVQTMIDHFFIYYNMCETQMALADQVDNCSSTQSLVATTNTGGQWQVPTPGICGDGFGARGGAHKGIDIAAPSGTPIVAPTSMKIVFVGVSRDGTTGNQITATATDGSGYSFRFMHMLDRGSVQVGQEVSKGTAIGKVGSTGDSSGPHLHLDVFPKGVDPMSYGGQVDPVKAMAEHGVSISCKQ